MTYEDAIAKIESGHTINEQFINDSIESGIIAELLEYAIYKEHDVLFEWLYPHLRHVSFLSDRLWIQKRKAMFLKRPRLFHDAIFKNNEYRQGILCLLLNTYDSISLYYGMSDDYMLGLRDDILAYLNSNPKDTIDNPDDAFLLTASLSYRKHLYESPSILNAFVKSLEGEGAIAEALSRALVLKNTNLLKALMAAHNGFKCEGCLVNYIEGIGHVYMETRKSVAHFIKHNDSLNMDLIVQIGVDENLIRNL